MPEATRDIGDEFLVQFVWKLPDGDFIRAIFRAEVLSLEPKTDRYVVRLKELVAGRQESESGEMRPREALAGEYWTYVGQIAGHRLALAYEAADGRALHLRLATLTGEHNYFSRLDDAIRYFEEEKVKRGQSEDNDGEM